LKEHNIQEVIDLGDTFDKRKSIMYSSLQKCKDYYFGPMRDAGIKLHIIVGNHCIPYKNLTTINSPDLLLKEYENVSVYPFPEEVVFDGTPILFLPWICAENASESHDKILSTTAAVAFGHLELAGFEMHAGVVHQGGMASDIFQKFKMVCSGHFHHRASNRNIHYLGCPYEMSWADYGDPKGFHVFDTDTLELEFIENPYKMYMKVFYDDTKWEKFNQKKLDFSKYAGSMVKLIVLGKKDANWFHLFKEKLEEQGLIDLTIEDGKIEISDIEEFETTDFVDLIDVMDMHIDVLEVDLDKNKLKLFLRQLHIEATELNATL
jgi:DNA repair exonuclease SbcCD nuclease subunit